MLLISLTQMSLVNGESDLATSYVVTLWSLHQPLSGHLTSVPVQHDNSRYAFMSTLKTVTKTKPNNKKRPKTTKKPNQTTNYQKTKKTPHKKSVGCYTESCYCLCIKKCLAWSPATRIYTAVQLRSSWETRGSIASALVVECLHESRHPCLAPDWSNAHHSLSLPAAACPSPPPKTCAPGWLASSRQGKTLEPGLSKQRNWLCFSIVPLESSYESLPLPFRVSHTFNGSKSVVSSSSAACRDRAQSW